MHHATDTEPRQTIGVFAVYVVFLAGVSGMLLSLIYPMSSWIFHLSYWITLGTLAVGAFYLNNRVLLIATCAWSVAARFIPTVVSPVPLFASNTSLASLGVIQEIVRTGHIALPSYFFPGEAFRTIDNPALEIFGGIYVLTTGVPALSFSSLFGPMLGVPSLLLLYCFYRRFLSAGLSGVALLAFSFNPAFYEEGALTAHWNLATMFFCLMLVVIGVREMRKSWSVIAIVATIAIVVSHEMSSIIVPSLLFISFLVFLAARSTFNPPLVSPTLVGLSAGLMFVWDQTQGVFTQLLSVGSGYVGGVVNILTGATEPNYGNALARIPGVKPGWVVGVEYLGLVAFFVTMLLGVYAALKGKDIKIRSLLPLTVAAGGIFILFGVAVWAATSAGQDLQSRFLWYPYCLGAPVLAVGLSWIPERLSKIRFAANVKLPSRVKIIGILLLFLLGLPSVYYGIEPYFYDNSTPITSSDIRLQPMEWYSTGLFSKGHLGSLPVVGVNQVFYVYYFGQIDIGQRSSAYPWPTGENLTYFANNEKPAYIFLRINMVEIPAEGINTTNAELEAVINASDVLYRTGTIVILVPLPQ